MPVKTTVRIFTGTLSNKNMKKIFKIYENVN